MPSNSESDQNTQTNTIQPFIDTIKNLLSDLLAKKYEKIYLDFARHPWPENVLRRILEEEAPYGIDDRLYIDEFLPDKPEGLYQWTIPPDEYLIEAIGEGTGVGTPMEIRELYGDEDSIVTLKTLFDHGVDIPDSKWSIRIYLWCIGGMSQCSADLMVSVSDGRLSIFLQEIGVM